MAKLHVKVAIISVNHNHKAVVGLYESQGEVQNTASNHALEIYF
jgi:hypothetical protein